MVKNKKSYFHRSPNNDRQIAAMRALYPQFSAHMYGKHLIFVGKLQAKEDFPAYKVKIEYRGAYPPFVSIIEPKLMFNTPHIYSKTKHLCLYHPDNYRWSIDKLVATDIVPWTVAWIYFYEYWLQTGEWVGPEVPHITKKEENTKDE